MAKSSTREKPRATTHATQRGDAGRPSTATGAERAAEAFSPEVDLEARQEGIGATRRASGPDIGKLARTRARPSKAAETTPD